MKSLYFILSLFQPTIKSAVFAPKKYLSLHIALVLSVNFPNCIFLLSLIKKMLVTM